MSIFPLCLSLPPSVSHDADFFFFYAQLFFLFPILHSILARRFKPLGRLSRLPLATSRIFCLGLIFGPDEWGNRDAEHPFSGLISSTCKMKVGYHLLPFAAAHMPILCKGLHSPVTGFGVGHDVFWPWPQNVREPPSQHWV